MSFEPKPSTIVKSIAQRGLLKWWSDPRRGGWLPSLADCEVEELARAWADMALYVVERSNGGRRYKCLRHGIHLRPIDGGDLTGLYIDEFLRAPLRDGALAAYDATVTRACPIYTMRNAIDEHQVPVTFERLRLPLGREEITHLLTHVEIFCEDGRYQRQNLLVAGLSRSGYSVSAAISMAAGLSPGAQVIGS